MSAIAGFFNPYQIYANENSFIDNAIHSMSKALIKRGPDQMNATKMAHGSFCYNALTACRIHPKIACSPMPLTQTFFNHTYTFLYDGYITNLTKLSQKLSTNNIATKGLTQEQLLLSAFVHFGPSFVKFLDGAFAMAIYDDTQKQLYLFRDQLGIRPLYYMISNQTILFASEPKGIFAYPGITPTITLEGLNEIFSMGPARSLGKGVYKSMYEVKAGHFISYKKDSFYDECYHKFYYQPHKDSYTDTVDHIHQLLDQSFSVLTDTTTTPTSLLSGGLDSSVITAELVKRRSDISPLKTFSFDFLGSRRFFRANSFQPSLDAPYVHQMVDYLNTDHTTLVCGNQEQMDYLWKSVDAHDLPAMADIDSSLLYFCEKIAPQHKTIFTGECADELFAGYPWYHREEMYQSDTFPWSMDISSRKFLLKDDFISSLDMDTYIHDQYRLACSDIASIASERSQKALHAKTMYFTMRYFMQTLINRTDRVASYNSLDIRVPFADFALAEYLFSVPYEMKTKDGQVKHLLREYAKGLLPEDVRTRQKSPYPKTYDPGYEQLLTQKLASVIANPNSPICEFIDPQKVSIFCENPKDYGKPWYGQLMAAPQLIAYYLQINYWIEKYKIKIELS